MCSRDSCAQYVAARPALYAELVWSVLAKFGTVTTVCPNLLLLGGALQKGRALPFFLYF